MEKLKKLLDFLSPLPAWLRVVIVALVTAIVSVCVLMTACTMASSCGITQSTVNNFNSDNNTIEMSVTPSTTTTTTASPEIPINTPLQNSLFAVFVVLSFARFKDGETVMRRICVESDDSDLAKDKVCQFLDAFSFTSDNPLRSYHIHNIVPIPSLFYWD